MDFLYSFWKGSKGDAPEHPNYSDVFDTWIIVANPGKSDPICRTSPSLLSLTAQDLTTRQTSRRRGHTGAARRTSTSLAMRTRSSKLLLPSPAPASSRGSRLVRTPLQPSFNPARRCRRGGADNSGRPRNSDTHSEHSPAFP